MKLSFLIKAPEAGTVKVAVEKASADSGSSDFRASRSIPSPAPQVTPVHGATGGHGLTEPQSADAAREPGAVGAVAEPVVRQNSPTIEAASDRPIESAVTSTSSVTGVTSSVLGVTSSVTGVTSSVTGVTSSVTGKSNIEINIEWQI